MKLHKRHMEMFAWLYEGEGKEARRIKIPDDCDFEFIVPHPDLDETWSSGSFKARAYDGDKEFHPPKPKHGHHWIAGQDEAGDWYFIEIEN